jgi:uncharacterized protein
MEIAVTKGIGDELPQRKRVLSRRSLFCLVPPLLLAGRALAARARGPLMWLASRKDANVYIFGVGGSPDRKWFNHSIESAVNASKEVWGESPVGPVNISNEFIQQLGTRAQGSLFDDLSAQQTQRVLNLVAKLGFPREQLQTMKPWYAARVLSGVLLAKEGTPMETMETPDTVIIDLAEKAGKAVKSEYSTWEQFMRFFDQMPKPTQVQYLSYELDFAEKGSGAYKAADDAWERSDSDYFVKNVTDMMRRYPDLYRALLIERNANWVRRIDGFLSAGGEYFIVVGLNHTLGPDSIERQLRERGIPVRAVQTKPDSAF